MTSQLYIETQGTDTDERISVVNGTNGTTQVTLGAASTLPAPYLTSIGLDTAAGWYFAIANSNNSNGAYLVRGAIAGGTPTTITDPSADFVHSSSTTNDDDVVSALAVDSASHTIYIGIADQSNNSTSGILQYSYDPATGAVGTGTLLTTLGASNKSDNIFDPNDFALGNFGGAQERLYFTEFETNNLYSVNIATPNVVTQLLDSNQFSYDNIDSGLVTDVEVDAARGHVFFDTQSLSAYSSNNPGNANYVAGQNAIFMLPASGAAGATPTQVTITGLPNTNHYFGHMTFDAATNQLYVVSEEDQASDTDDVIYVLQLNDAGTAATYVTSITPSPALHTGGNIGGLAVNDLATVAATGTAAHATEQGAAINVLAAGAIADPDGGYLRSATAAITGGTFASNESSTADDHLAINGQTSGLISGTNITVAYTAGTETLTLTGYDTIAHYNQVLANLQYNATGDNPTNYGQNTTRTVTITADDGSNGVAPAPTSVTISLDAVNDAPVNAVPATQTIAEDTSVTFSAANGNAITVSDPDAVGSSYVTVTVSATHGTLSQGGPSFGSSHTFSASQTAINGALSGLMFIPDANFNGAAMLTVTSNDNGNTGSGGAKTDTDTITVNVAPVNDAPVVVGGTTATATTTTAGAPSATGDTVSSLFASHFSDATDNQSANGGTNASGTLAGVAVIANASTAGVGQWQYLAGATWTDIGTVSTSSAHTFAAGTALRFSAVAGYSGAAPTLSAVLIETGGPAITDGGAINLSAGGGGTTHYSVTSNPITLTDTVTNINTAPVVGGIMGDIVAYNEGTTAVRVDLGGNATVSDADSANFNGGSLNATISGVTDPAHDGLVLSTADGMFTVSGGTLYLGSGTGTPIGTITQAGAALSVQFTSDLVTPTVAQNLLHELTFQTTSGDNPVGGLRTISYTLTDGDGTANNGHDTASFASSVNVVAVNDAPTLSAPTAASVTFTEGDTATALFAGTVLADPDQPATFANGSLTLVTTGDGGVALDPNSGFTVANGTLMKGGLAIGTISGIGSVNVQVTALTANATAAVTANLATAFVYMNGSDDPAAGDRTVTLTFNDGGNTSNAGNPMLAAQQTQTLHVTAVNDAPTATATALSPTYIQGANGNQTAPVALFNGAAISTIEANQTIVKLTLAVSGIANGAAEHLVVDGSAVSLADGTVGTTTGGLNYAVAVTGGNASVSISSTAGISAAAAQALVNGLAYQDTDTVAPTAGDRTVTLASVQHSGGSDDTVTPNLSSTVHVVVPALAVALTADTGTSGTDHLTRNPGIAVTNDPSLTLSYVVDGGSSSASYAAPVGQGNHTVIVTGTDPAGHTASQTLQFTLDTLPPALTAALTVDSGASATDGVTNNASLSVTNEAGAPVSYALDNGAATGSYTAPTTEGPHSVVVTAVDAAGNVASRTVNFTLDTTPPGLSAALAHDTGASASDGITSDASLAVTTEQNATVTYAVDNAAAATTYAAPTMQGPHSVVVSAADVAGNVTSKTVSFVLDSAAPSVDIQRSSNNHVPTGTYVDATGQMTPYADIYNGQTYEGGTNTTRPVTLNGTAEAGSTVTVTDTLNGGTPVAVAVTTTANGSWSAVTGANLGEGEHHFVATARDAAGNVATDSYEELVRRSSVGNSVPNQPVLSTISDAHDTTGTASPNVIANHGLVFSGTADAYSLITVYVGTSANGGGTAVADQVQAGADGHWYVAQDPSRGALPETAGQLTFVQVTATDLAGNSASNGTASYQVDTTNPTLAFTQVNYTDSSGGSHDTNVAPVSFAGTVSDDHTVDSVVVNTFTNNVQTGTITAQVNADGTWTASGNLATEGTHTYTVTATDEAGNQTTTGNATSFIYDHTAPALSNDSLTYTNTDLVTHTATVDQTSNGAITVADTVTDALSPIRSVQVFDAVNGGAATLIGTSTTTDANTAGTAEHYTFSTTLAQGSHSIYEG